ncbi:hypothetical protein BC830DRAFT_1112493, partial [Chytriomyces sp. MP71]
ASLNTRTFPTAFAVDFALLLLLSLCDCHPPGSTHRLWEPLCLHLAYPSPSIRIDRLFSAVPRVEQGRCWLCSLEH